MSKGAKLVDAVGALAPIDFVVLKSCKFLASRSRSHRKSQKVSSAPALLGLIGVLDNHGNNCKHLHFTGIENITLQPSTSPTEDKNW